MGYRRTGCRLGAPTGQDDRTDAAWSRLRRRDWTEASVEDDVSDWPTSRCKEELAARGLPMPKGLIARAAPIMPQLADALRPHLQPGAMLP